MASEIKRNPVEYFKFVYSSVGPRGDWDDVVNEQGEVTRKSKILEAGYIYVLHNTEGMNAFLTGQGLPAARKISQPQHDGFLKDYLVLDLSVEEWDQRIKPVRDQFEQCLTKFIASSPKQSA